MGSAGETGTSNLQPLGGADTEVRKCTEEKIWSVIYEYCRTVASAFYCWYRKKEIKKSEKERVLGEGIREREKERYVEMERGDVKGSHGGKLTDQCRRTVCGPQGPPYCSISNEASMLQSSSAGAGHRQPRGSTMPHLKSVSSGLQYISVQHSAIQ